MLKRCRIDRWMMDTDVSRGSGWAMHSELYFYFDGFDIEFP